MARHVCPETAAVGAELLAAVAVGLATLRRHLTDPDPKTALRAVAELTKLLSVCARHALAVGAEKESVPLEVPSPVTPIPEAEPVDPSRKRERRNEDVPSKLPLPGGRGAHAPSLVPPAQALPPGGPPRLTSFLGAPVSPRPSAPAPATG